MDWLNANEVDNNDNNDNGNNDDDNDDDRNNDDKNDDDKNDDDDRDDDDEEDKAIEEMTEAAEAAEAIVHMQNEELQRERAAELERPRTPGREYTFASTCASTSAPISASTSASISASTSADDDFNEELEVSSSQLRLAETLPISAKVKKVR